MRIAVPLFGDELAPRFGYADKFLVADVQHGRVENIFKVRIEIVGWQSRLEQLKKIGVDTVLCGGFNRLFVPLAQDLGINVLAGLIGNAHGTMEAFARGDAITTSACQGMGRGKRSGKNCNCGSCQIRKRHRRGRLG